MSERKTILVVEDSPDERSFVVSVLDDAGYLVREAADGSRNAVELGVAHR